MHGETLKCFSKCLKNIFMFEGKYVHCFNINMFKNKFVVNILS